MDRQLVNWRFSRHSITFMEGNLSPHQRRQLLEIASLQILFIIWIADVLALVHVVEVRIQCQLISWQNFICLFNQGGLQLVFCFLFIMVHWQCFILESLILSLKIKAVVGICACANSLDDFDWRLLIVGSHFQNQNLLSFFVCDGNLSPC